MFENIVNSTDSVKSFHWISLERDYKICSENILGMSRGSVKSRRTYCCCKQKISKCIINLYEFQEMLNLPSACLQTRIYTTHVFANARTTGLRKIREGYFKIKTAYCLCVIPLSLQIKWGQVR